MESSLERSLEMAAIHSDGLSDKERQVRAVKNTIRTHRRTASVSSVLLIETFPIQVFFLFPEQTNISGTAEMIFHNSVTIGSSGT